MWDKGFEWFKIDGYLYQLELGLKYKIVNFGMFFLYCFKFKWFMGVDFFDLLFWNDIFVVFEECYVKGGYFEGLMKKYLLNDNIFIFIMVLFFVFVQEFVKEEEFRLKGKIVQVVEFVGGEEQVQKVFEIQELVLLVE